MNSPYWVLCFTKSNNHKTPYLERALSIQLFHGTIEECKIKATEIAREQDCVVCITSQLHRFDSEITVREV